MMFIELLERTLWIILFLASLNVLRHGYFLVQTWVRSKDENPEKYYLTPKSLILLGISIGYIITVIIKGISL